MLPPFASPRRTIWKLSLALGGSLTACSTCTPGRSDIAKEARYCGENGRPFDLAGSTEAAQRAHRVLDALKNARHGSLSWRCPTAAVCELPEDDSLSLSFEAAPNHTCDLSTCDMAGVIEPRLLHSARGGACDRALVVFGVLHLKTSSGTLNASFEANLVVDSHEHGHLVVDGHERDSARVASARPDAPIQLGISLVVDGASLRGQLEAAREAPERPADSLAAQADGEVLLAPVVEAKTPLWQASWEAGPARQ